jgi:hypothetical protein
MFDAPDMNVTLKPRVNSMPQVPLSAFRSGDYLALFQRMSSLESREKRKKKEQFSFTRRRKKRSHPDSSQREETIF